MALPYHLTTVNHVAARNHNVLNLYGTYSPRLLLEHQAQAVFQQLHIAGWCLPNYSWHPPV